MRQTMAFNAAVLSVEQMSAADRLTIERGITGAALMEAAGQSITRLISEKYGVGHALVLCGPGNNGGDGFVVARHLFAQGWTVTVGLLGDLAELRGDAALMARQWTGQVHPLTSALLQKTPDVIVDGLFGAGLTRDVAGELAALIKQINELPSQRVAIDIPSGIYGDTGQVAGVAFAAHMTVTFFRPKPGHLLYPGRRYAGALYVTDIGIPDRVLHDIAPTTYENSPALWQRDYPWPQREGHKYSRGHAVIVSGDEAHTGAARLAARAALRIGAGLVSVAAPSAAVMPLAAQLTAVMIKPFQGHDAFLAFLADERLNAWCIGPANGVTAHTKARVLSLLQPSKDRRPRSCVLDADALTVFADAPAVLWDAIAASGQPVVLTPHEGEFGRLFPDLADQKAGKLQRARLAAARSGAVVILKGPDTIIAAPDGRAVINTNAPATLATAGSGDVLAGMVTGLQAQSMPAFAASCAAVWLHSAAAASFGPGLIAEDIETVMPQQLRQLKDAMAI